MNIRYHRKPQRLSLTTSTPAKKLAASPPFGNFLPWEFDAPRKRPALSAADVLEFLPLACMRTPRDNDSSDSIIAKGSRSTRCTSAMLSAEIRAVSAPIDLFSLAVHSSPVASPQPLYKFKRYLPASRRSCGHGSPSLLALQGLFSL